MYLSERKQFLTIKNRQSPTTLLEFGVLQCSVLGCVLFIMYTTPLSHAIDDHSVEHEMFADDTQLCKSASPVESDDLFLSLQECTADVKVWMNANKLKLNDDKTAEASLDSVIQTPNTFPLGACEILSPKKS